MPSTTDRQTRFMAMAAHSPAKAKAAGIPQRVAKDFNREDSRTGRLSRATRKHSPLRKIKRGY